MHACVRRAVQRCSHGRGPRPRSRAELHARRRRTTLCSISKRGLRRHPSQGVRPGEEKTKQNKAIRKEKPATVTRDSAPRGRGCAALLVASPHDASLAPPNAAFFGSLAR